MRDNKLFRQCVPSHIGGLQVDTNNLISLTSRFPAGTYDLARLEGAFEDEIELRVGRDGETYEAIARGPFNLANLPVLCDSLGPFGSPTSDSARTMVTADCRDALLVLYGFGYVSRAFSPIPRDHRSWSITGCHRARRSSKAMRMLHASRSTCLASKV